MSETIVFVNNAIDTFGSAFDKVNQLINLANTDVVTVNVGGGVTIGSGFVVGKFGANTITTSTIVGGNTTVNGAINVLSNTTFANVVSILANLSVNANILLSNSLQIGNLASFFATVNSSSVSVGNSIYTSILSTSNLTLGNSTSNVVVNSTVVQIGPTLLLNANNLDIGNSSVFNLSNATSTFVVNPVGFTSITSTALSSVNSLTSAILTPSGLSVGNASGNTVITYNTISTATLSGNLNTSFLIGIIQSNSISGNYSGITGLGTLGSIVTSGHATIGAGLAVTGNSTVNAITAVGNSMFTGSVRVANDIIIAGNLFVSGNVTYSNASVGYSNVIPISTGFNLGNTSNPWTTFVAGSGTFQNPLTCISNINVGGDAFFAGNVNISGFLNGNITSQSTQILSTLSFGANNDVQIRSLASPTVGSVNQTLDTFPIASYRSAKYVLQVEDNVANNYYVSEILVLHDGTTAYLTEYAALTSNSFVGTWTANVVSGVVQLNFFPTSANTTVKLTRTLIAI